MTRVVTEKLVDKKMPSIKYTSPGSGTVLSINRGEKRRFLSIILELEGDDEVAFNSYSESELPSLQKKTERA
jgi:Na+-transporting NADH:ubiquinone oxidoreductase subunit A